MNILLFGPPGAGKGTQSTLLVEHLGMKHISTGDLFRSAIKNETTLGLEAKKYMDKGSLVPDSVTIGMVEEEFKKMGSDSFILDGFPRTVPQAEALENLLKKYGKRLDKALFLEVPESQLMGRLTGRRVCKNCGAVYHIESKPTRKDGVCDACGGAVVQRADDKAEVIKNRLDAYTQSTKPLKAYYAEAEKFVAVDGLGESTEVFERICQIVGGIKH